MPQSWAFLFSPYHQDPVSVETVYADCILGECDAVVSVTYRAYAYQVSWKPGITYPETGKSAGRFGMASSQVLDDCWYSPEAVTT